MIHVRKTYEINPAMYEACNTFFHTHVLPNCFKHGATLLGRWVTADKREITEMWEYISREVYEQVEHDELSHLYMEQREEIVESTGVYHYPTHTVAVTGLIRNEQGEVLLVKVTKRNDSWEAPGGQVERGETLEEAFRREVKEETGVDIEVGEMIGVYQAVERSVYIVMFYATCKGSDITIQPEEIEAAAFIPLTMDNIAEYMPRLGIRKRIEDGLQGKKNVYRAYTVNPYEVVAEIMCS